jgi:preprotein translocase SecE subunit
MARTRQKRKAKQRREQQLKATQRAATAKQRPTNPAEEAAIQTAEALEAADELEEIESGAEPSASEGGRTGGAAREAQAPPSDSRQAREDTVGGVSEPTEPSAREGGDGAAVTTRERRAPAPERRKEARPERRRERKPAERRKEPRQRGRVMNFFVQVWAELRRVQWPDRNQVTQATGVVVVFCLLAGAYLALWDFVFSELVTTIL